MSQRKYYEEHVSRNVFPESYQQAEQSPEINELEYKCNCGLIFMSKKEFIKHKIWCKLVSITNSLINWWSN